MTVGELALLTSPERIRRTVGTESAYTLARLGVLERLPGNPVGVATREVDGIVATMARHLPVASFNAVTGLCAGQERHVAPLVRWYRDAGVAAQFELVPDSYDPALGRALTRAGYFHAGFHTSLTCAPWPAARDAGTPMVERVTTPALLEVFLDAYVAGWQLPEAEPFKQNVRPWFDLPGWQLYLARVDGRPAAAGTLYLREGVGYCADAATDPRFRRRGLQSALLTRRIADASAAGVDFVCSGADFLSTSHANMERAGMRIQFVRALWRELG